MAAKAKAEANAVTVRPTWAKDLNDREMIFVEHYVRDMNATKAGLAAGFSKASAHVLGHECKHRPHVRAVIDLLLRDRMSSLKLSLAERLTAVALQDPRDYFKHDEKTVTQVYQSGLNPDGTPKFKTRRYMEPTLRITPMKKLDERQRAALKGIKKRVTPSGTTIEVILHDPINATQRLAELLGMTQAEEGAGGGHISFIIETPDGTVVKPQHGAAPIGINRNAIDAEIAKNTEPDADELPPGARMIVEPP